MASVYFLVACIFLRRRSKVNLWKIWWQTGADTLKTERRFADEIRKFPVLHLGYGIIKWGTLVVVSGYLATVFLFLIRR